MEAIITKEDFLDYETVRKSGMHNMMEPQARALADLSREQWIIIIKNYSELKNKYLGGK